MNRRSQHLQSKKRKTKKSTKKAIKSQKRNNPYSYLQSLDMTYVETKNSKYHNSKSDKIRRNEPWSEAVVLKQKCLFSFGGDMIMLSRVHFKDFKVASLNIYISEFKNGPFVKVCESIHLPHGNERVVKVGSLPCKYMMIEMEKGVPLLQLKKISAFGISCLLYTSPSPRDQRGSRMPSSA